MADEPLAFGVIEEGGEFAGVLALDLDAVPAQSELGEGLVGAWTHGLEEELVDRGGEQRLHALEHGVGDVDRLRDVGEGVGEKGVLGAGGGESGLGLVVVDGEEAFGDGVSRGGGDTGERVGPGARGRGREFHDADGVCETVEAMDRLGAREIARDLVVVSDGEREQIGEFPHQREGGGDVSMGDAKMLAFPCGADGWGKIARLTRGVETGEESGEERDADVEEETDDEGLALIGRVREFGERGGEAGTEERLAPDLAREGIGGAALGGP